MPRYGVQPASDGFTLIEMVVAIVVIAAAVTAIMATVGQSVRTSADPQIRSQGLAIANAYLEEIMLKDFQDPDQPETGTEETSRDLYDDVQDYHGLADNGAQDQYGTALAGLTDYNVAVSVAASSINGLTTQRVTVTVTHDSHGMNLVLSAHKSNY